MRSLPSRVLAAAPDEPRPYEAGAPRILVTDVDRTLTTPDLRVPGGSVQRLRELREAGVLLVLASGRSLQQLDEMGLLHEADAVVAENGAVVLAPPLDTPELADPTFVARAQAALGEMADRFAWRDVIASGPREHAFEASVVLLRHGVDHAMSYNAEEVMVLPDGIDKAVGVERALAAWNARLDEAWAIGDGENDAPLLAGARVGVAPGNAHEMARRAASVTTLGEYHLGFLEFTEKLLGAP